MAEQSFNSAAGNSPVEVRIAADLRQLPTLRALAETIALLSDFTLDEVSDVRLAVDEVASILVVDAAPGAVLCCLFAVDEAGMRVTMRTVSRREGVPDQRNFGWHVLRTLTDSLRTEQQPYDAAGEGYPTVVEFSRVRGSASAG
jgi:serine/threonine-protein kinase RsbW